MPALSAPFLATLTCTSSVVMVCAYYKARDAYMAAVRPSPTEASGWLLLGFSPHSGAVQKATRLGVPRKRWLTLSNGVFLMALLLEASLIADAFRPPGPEPDPHFDPHEVLGLAQTASVSEIKLAYRRLSLQLHPDGNFAADAEELHARVSLAHEVLTDPSAAENYRRYGSVEPRRSIAEEVAVVLLRALSLPWVLLTLPTAYALYIVLRDTLAREETVVAQEGQRLYLNAALDLDAVRAAAEIVQAGEAPRKWLSLLLGRSPRGSGRLRMSSRSSGMSSGSAGGLSPGSSPRSSREGPSVSE